MHGRQWNTEPGQLGPHHDASRHVYCLCMRHFSSLSTVVRLILMTYTCCVGSGTVQSRSRVQGVCTIIQRSPCSRSSHPLLDLCCARCMLTFRRAAASIDRANTICSVRCWRRSHTPAIHHLPRDQTRLPPAPLCSVRPQLVFERQRAATLSTHALVPTAMADSSPPGCWRSFGTPSAELRLEFTLPTGQSFRWRQTGDNEFTGVIGQRVVRLELHNFVFPCAPACLFKSRRDKTA